MFTSPCTRHLRAAVIDEKLRFVTGNGNGAPHTGVDDTRAYKLSLFPDAVKFTTASRAVLFNRALS